MCDGPEQSVLAGFEPAVLVGFIAFLAGTGAEHVKGIVKDRSALPIGFLGSKGVDEFRIRRIAQNH